MHVFTRPSWNQRRFVKTRQIGPTMDHPGFQQGCQQGCQQGWECSEVSQGDDQEDLSLHRRDFDWTNVGQSQIATNVTGQAAAVGLEHFQAVFPGFEQSPSADPPLNLADTGCQFPADDQSAQPNPLPWPLPQSNLEPHSGPIFYELSTGTDLPLSAADADQFPANVQSFQQTLLPWPKPQSINTLSSSLFFFNYFMF